MVAIQARQVDAYLTARQPPAERIILFYGPDRGLSSDRALALSKKLSNDDSSSVLRLDGDELAGTPDRILEEAHAESLFDPIRVIRLRVGDKNLGSAISSLLSDPPDDKHVIIEAGDIRPKTGLRKLVEGSPQGAALPSYVDSQNAVGTLIDACVREAGLTIHDDARAFLMTQLGSDHALSRMEIEKLCLYAAGQPDISITDVRAICGDTGSGQIDAFVDAVVDRNLEAAVRQIRRMRAAGVSDTAALTMLVRHFLDLDLAALQVWNGSSSDDAVSAFGGRIFPSRRQAIRHQIDAWPRPLSSQALSLLQKAALQSRRHNGLESISLDRAIVSLCAMKAQRRKGS